MKLTVPLALADVGNAKVDFRALQPVLTLLAMSGDIARPAFRETCGREVDLRELLSRSIRR